MNHYIEIHSRTKLIKRIKLENMSKPQRADELERIKLQDRTLTVKAKRSKKELTTN